MKTPILGIDIDGVIIDRINDNTDTSFFSNNYLRTTAVPEAFETIGKLVRMKFGENAFIVSKCGIKVQKRTLEWLKYHNFYALTGILPENVHFCFERHEKAGICEKLGITHFIDDRLEVLSYLSMVQKRYLFQPSAHECRKFAHVLPCVIPVNSWEEILTLEIT